MLPNPGSVPTEPSSYKPICLLPALSKFFEKFFLSRLKPILKQEAIIPNHQFRFREQHTIEQVKCVSKQNKTIFRTERIMCCSLPRYLLDIEQAFAIVRYLVDISEETGIN